jgi:hypothetical protein
VCGGFAVQELGYPRFTVHVDIIVPEVELAIEKFDAQLVSTESWVKYDRDGSRNQS